MTSALIEARRQGHSPSAPAHEEAGFGSFAYCTKCFRYICVDLDESKEPYDLVFLDFQVDPTENVYPMVQGGKGLTDMILSAEDL